MILMLFTTTYSRYRRRHNRFLWYLFQWGVLEIMVCLMVACAVEPRPSVEPTYPLQRADVLLLPPAKSPAFVVPDACYQSDGSCMLRQNLAYRSFHRQDNGHDAFSQDVYAFGDVGRAGAEYTELYQADVRAFSSPNHQYDVHASVPYQSIYADSYTFMCGYKDLDYCHAFFRYRNYVVILFLTPTDRGDGLTYDEMTTVITAVDKHVAAVLGISGVPVTASPTP